MLDFIKIALAEGHNKFLGAIAPDCDPTAATSSGGCGGSQLIQLGVNIVQFLIDISILIAVVLFLWGGFLFLTSGGSEKQITSGRKTITNAVIGIVIVLGSWIIINTFLTLLTNCTGEWWKFKSLNC